MRMAISRKAILYVLLGLVFVFTMIMVLTFPLLLNTFVYRRESIRQLTECAEKITLGDSKEDVLRVFESTRYWRLTLIPLVDRANTFGDRRT